ncbi:hypothetical protein D9613_000245 [Agrocybe pediades]|uniref:Uncharacterized protein n=1 Tax=Agrocybe pediades TaxID=84607 RepID=A0A8H4VRS4_9AGAR|nr:hypothetical protein D9613_000245 [Agrocybe pediades]
MPATFFINWRIVRPLLFICFLVTISLYYVYYTFKPPTALYNDLFVSETQASKDLIHNERGNRYVKFNQLQGAGFNNQAQEILLYHHLALQTSRVYVYQPLIWRPRGETAGVPLSAFLPGVTDNSVSDSVFDEVCPPEEVVHVKLRANDLDQWNHAKTILNQKDRCIVVDDRIFNWAFLESAGTHTIWPSFQKYLGIHYKWSDIILDITNRTQTQLQLKPAGEPYMALHLRRGDFEGHCEYLADSRKGFTTWATLPVLQPAVFPPALDTYNHSSVVEHCYPTLYRILDAVSAQARRKPHLRTLHIIHDGAWDHPTVYLQFYKLAEALKNEGWAKDQDWPSGPMLRITQSAHTPIARGERDFAVCVDVEMARRAEVFIGNPYSSLSTQVAALRLGDGGQVEDITFV